MTVRPPESAPGRDERAVSPVVGMILVLAISIVGIAAILYWGLPAIDEMKANVEYRSVSTQFTELDNTIHELVSGTTEKTAKRWEPSINRGSVLVANKTEGWVYAVELYNATKRYNFTYTDLNDGDNWFNITSKTEDVTNLKVEGYLITSSSTQVALNVTDGSVPPPQQMGSVAVTWTHDTTKAFSVWQQNVCCGDTVPQYPQQRLEEGTYHFRISSGGTPIAEMWWVQTGRVVYSLQAGVGDKTVILNNGAVIDGANGAYSIINTPSIPPDSTSSGVPRFFGRILTLNGSASFAGDNHFSILVSLDSTATLASYDCVKSDFSDCVQSVKFEMFGTYANVWRSYLQNTGLGYRFGVDSSNAGATVVQEFSNHMAFTLLGSNLRVTQ